MLPNKMRISKKATKSLMRLQNNTGLTPNIGARLAFFSSIEKGYRFNPKTDQIEHNGRELDKHTWLGDYATLAEILLKQNYPSCTKKELYAAWAGHVDYGSRELESKQQLASLIKAL